MNINPKPTIKQVKVEIELKSHPNARIKIPAIGLKIPISGDFIKDKQSNNIKVLNTDNEVEETIICNINNSNTSTDRKISTIESKINIIH